ncbi:hypothetical protein L873DRAFT_1796825, partial [Choiromyces venosus 120613-1]
DLTPSSNCLLNPRPTRPIRPQPNAMPHNIQPLYSFPILHKPGTPLHHPLHNPLGKQQAYFPTPPPQLLLYPSDT